MNNAIKKIIANSKMDLCLNFLVLVDELGIGEHVNVLARETLKFNGPEGIREELKAIQARIDDNVLWGCDCDHMDSIANNLGEILSCVQSEAIEAIMTTEVLERR